MNLNIRHNFSSSFPFSASSLKSNSQKRERRKKIERHTKEVKLFYFSFCCLYSPFLFRICVHIVSARLCFPSQPTNGANRNYYALYTVFKRGTKPSHSIFLPFCVYRNVVSKFSMRTAKQTKVDYFFSFLLFHLKLITGGYGERAKTHGAHGLSSTRTGVK